MTSERTPANIGSKSYRFPRPVRSWSSAALAHTVLCHSRSPPITTVAVRRGGRAGLAAAAGAAPEPDDRARPPDASGCPRVPGCGLPRAAARAAKAATAPAAARPRPLTRTVTHERRRGLRRHACQDGWHGPGSERAQPGGADPRPRVAHDGRRRRSGRARRRRRCRRHRGRARRGHPRPVHRSPGAARPGQRHQQPQQQADPRRAPLPRDARLRPGARGTSGARPAAQPAGAAPGPAGAVPLPADPPRLGATVRRLRTAALRRDGEVRPRRGGSAAAPAPDPQDGRPDRTGLRAGVDRRRDPLLRLPGRRRPAGGHRGPHRRRARRPARHPGEGHRLPPRGRAGGRRPGGGPRGRPRARGPCPGGRQRGRRVDRPDPGDGRWPRRAARAGVQGHPPRRPARPDPLRGGLHRAHRDVRPLRDPLGPALDHRHDRHPVGPRQGAPRGEPRRHRLRPRPRQRDPARAAGPRGRRGRLRRAAAAALRASPSRPRGSPASTPSSRRCPAW